MSDDVNIVWFRSDLRVADNPALDAAMRRGRVVPVFIWSPDEEGDWPLGAASRWWLHQSLRSLDEHLGKRGSRLIVRKGASLQSLRDLISDTGASAVYWNRRYEPAAIARDAQVEKPLTADGTSVETFNGSLLFEPDAIRNKAGLPFRVFTPFWKTCLKSSPGHLLPAPRQIPSPRSWPESDELDALELEPMIDWAAGIRAAWKPGERESRRQLRAFVKNGLHRYDADRNRVDIDGSSRLSPHLRFGEISPRQVWHAVDAEADSCPKASNAFMSEIGWREFAYHLLVHFPDAPSKPLRPEFERFPWSHSRARLRRWQQGMTGYPIVDAAMRQLWQTGWMPNRARMIVASFLTKDLLLAWQDGARWFWDTLVDADLANNTLGWQWTAGCGADAAPFFRIFNPVSQAEKFDPQGAYIRRWVPEIAALPAPWIYQPWKAPEDVLRDNGVRLGKTYPKPMVDHAEAREKALAAYQSCKSA